MRKYKIKFVTVEDRSDEIVKELAKDELKKVLNKHGAESPNLDNVLDQYLGDMNDKELRLRESLNLKRVAEG